MLCSNVLCFDGWNELQSRSKIPKNRAKCASKTNLDALLLSLNHFYFKIAGVSIIWKHLERIMCIPWWFNPVRAAVWTELFMIVQTSTLISADQHGWTPLPLNFEARNFAFLVNLVRLLDFFFSNQVQVKNSEWGWSRWSYFNRQIWKMWCKEQQQNFAEYKNEIELWTQKSNNSIQKSICLCFVNNHFSLKIILIYSLINISFLIFWLFNTNHNREWSSETYFWNCIVHFEVSAEW